MRISDWSSDVCSSDLRPERTAVARMLLKVLLVVLVIAYPILVHASVMLDAPRLALIALILLVCVGLFRPLAALRVWAWLTLAATSALLFALMRTAGGIYAVCLPSLVMPAVLAW